MQRLDDRSRMSGDVHVRFCESLRGQFPRATRLIIMVKSLSAGQRVMDSIRRFLERELRLTVNEKKSKVGSVEECGFLGFVFVRGKIRWSDRAFREFKRRIRLFTGRSWFVSMEYRLHKLAEYVRRWMNYYGISEYYRPIPEIDSWLRRRLRMCYWKQWRYARTKVYNLLKLGASQRQAIMTALSHNGPWHLARTLATQGRYDQQLAERTGVDIRQRTVGKDSLFGFGPITLMKRLILL